jgi:hypothetical protein
MWLDSPPWIRSKADITLLPFRAIGPVLSCLPPSEKYLSLPSLAEIFVWFYHFTAAFCDREVIATR